MSNSIKLSEEEYKILSDTSFLLTKQQIDKKISALLMNYQQELMVQNPRLFALLPSSILPIPKKISKGQNYNGLPYWVVDFPSHFEKENIFTFRVVVWWGNFISTSLILSGYYFEQVRLDFVKLGNSNFSFSINTNPWPIEFEPKNLIAVKSSSLNQIKAHYENSKFVKLSARHELNKIERLTSFCNKDLTSMLAMFDWRNI
uniref:hypothetical protein n=1 Tax=Roseivirga sp. TaxID=1964215 RepID=UPI004048C247